MTVDEFAALTQDVIDRDGFDEFCPTACFRDANMFDPWPACRWIRSWSRGSSTGSRRSLHPEKRFFWQHDDGRAQGVCSGRRGHIRRPVCNLPAQRRT